MYKSLNQLANTGKKWAVVTFTETSNWRDDIQKKAKKIEGVYLVNLKEPTYLCEMSVSYPATFLRNHFHNAKAFDEDELTEMEYDNGGEYTSYFSGYNCPKLIKLYKSGKEEYILEYESGNPSYC